jgi:TonB-linked SusC/RagA family outer membrane protein
MKKILLSLILLFGIVGFAVAQRTITGTVLDSKNEPMVGASILLKGTTTGTITDIDGKFELKVPENAKTLSVSFAGFQSQDVTLGTSNVINVTLAEAQLQEVVVTAMGIRRDKKALGYATTTVDAKDIANKPESDVARALAGKSPGVNIISSAGLAGSGTKINIRGVSTISGDAQPLWIVDGVPVNTSANEANSDFSDGQVTPTRNLDIDPNNIESISVLRGLSATTLYGSQGRNGVILITTKTGAASKSQKMTASFTQTYNTIEAFIPEFQNKWANGFDGDYGEFFSNWGSLFENPGLKINAPHPYFEHRDLFPEFPEFQAAAGDANGGYKPVPAPNNIKNFFQKGEAMTTSVNAGITGDIGSFNVSFSRLSENGYIKNNKLERYNATIGGTANLTNRLMLTGNFSIIRTDFKTPPVGAGLGSNSNGGPSVFANLFYTPRNIDLMNWPYQNPLTGASVYYRNNNSITNPRWLLENAGQTNNVNRFLSSFSANYSLTDWLKATYRLGIDSYNEEQSYYSNRGATGFPVEVAAMSTGFYRTTNGVNTIYDHSFILSGNRSINKEIDLTANIGVNGRQDNYIQKGLESQGQVVFGLLEHRNFANVNSRDIRGNNMNFRERRNILGAFADVTLGYKNAVYLNIQGRNDWASTHEKDYRSLLYPGVSLSFIPTELFPQMQSDILNFLKLRVGYGTSANFATPYRTRPTLNLNSNAGSDGLGSIIALGLPSLLANPNLKPELQTELEFGADIRLLNNRLGFDLSVYDRLAKDQIVERTLDPSTGFGRTFINAGSISNKGIELGVNITPLKMRDFVWNMKFNFTRNRSLVEELPEGSKEILIDGFSNLGNFAIQGQPFGVIKGTGILKHANGGRLINANGDYQLTPEAVIIGDPNEKFRLSGFTDFNFRGISLSAQLDYVEGGQIFSYSAATPIGRGTAKELSDFNPELPVILPGVFENGEPNNIPQPASGIFFGNTIIGGGVHEVGIFDATRIRLRELALSYDLPRKVFGKSFVKGVNISIVGNNLWFNAVNTPKSSKVDPDRTAFGTGNGTGFDFLGGPSARRWGANLKVSF